MGERIKASVPPAKGEMPQPRRKAKPDEVPEVREPEPVAPPVVSDEGTD